MDCPSKRKALQFSELSDEKIECAIFTDGSKIENEKKVTVGAACVLYRGGVETNSLKIKLDPRCSVYQSELMAILKSMSLVTRNDKSVAIISDSKSSLMSLEDRSSKNKMVNEIKKKVEELRTFGTEVKLYWTRAHAGQVGNEQADKYAKEAGEGGGQEELLPPLSWVKRQNKVNFNKQWSVDCGKWLKKTEYTTVCKFLNFPLESEILRKNLAWTAAHTWLLSGHGPFGSYLRRFRLKESSSCKCFALIQDSEHLLFRCLEGRLGEIRKKFKKYNARWEVMSDIVLGAKKCPEVVDELIEEISFILVEEKSREKSRFEIPIQVAVQC